MKRTDWPVTPYGVRPRGAPNECFYCRAKLGTQHALGCVIRSRTVVIRTIVEHTVDVPEDWGIRLIEFTEGSSCSDNHINKLVALLRRLSVTRPAPAGWSRSNSFVRRRPRMRPAAN
jgi:hypothetical protein